MGMRYTICRWAINRSDPQNLLSITLDVPLQYLLVFSQLFPISFARSALPLLSYQIAYHQSYGNLPLSSAYLSNSGPDFFPFLPSVRGCSRVA